MRDKIGFSAGLLSPSPPTPLPRITGGEGSGVRFRFRNNFKAFCIPQRQVLGRKRKLHFPRTSNVCFSAQASFTVGTALVPAGLYCIWSAWVKKRAFLGLAVVPLVFGVQQIGEGFVWTGINSGDAEQTRLASLFFLFFALAFWPFWFPVLTTIMEPIPKRRWIFGAVSVVAASWFWILFWPLVVDPSLLETRVDHHSIRYAYDGLAIYNYIDKTPLRVLYLLSVAIPPMFSSENLGRIPGLVLGASALLAATVYHYAFVSVWCFFAAVLAISMCVMFYRLPGRRHSKAAVAG